MAENEKLLTSLRINLDALRKDVNSANSILKSIQDTKINPIDISDGREAVSLLKLIQDEFKKIATTTGLKFDTTSIDNMRKSLESIDLKIKDTTKTIKEFREQQVALQSEPSKVIKETTKPLGKKEILTENYGKLDDGTRGITSSTLKIIDDENIKLREQKKLYSDINKSEIAEQKKLSDQIIDNADELLNFLKKQTDETKGLNKELKSAFDEQNKLDNEIERLSKISKSNDEKKLINSQLDNADNILKFINNQIGSAKEINKELKTELATMQKIETQQQKINIETLKQVTAEQANQKYVSGILSAKTLNERLGDISGSSRSQALGSGDARAKGFGDRFSIAKDYVISSKIFNTAFQSIDDAYETIKKYESGLVDLSRTLSNVTNKELKAFGEQAIKSSKDFGVPLQEVQNAMTELARAGIDNKDDLLKMTDSVLTGINTTEIKDSSQMVGALVSTVKQLGMSFQDTNKIIDSWNLLSDKYAVKSDDFAEALQKAGSSSKAFALSLHDVNAMTVLLGEATGKSGSELGNSIKTLETRMLRPETVKTLEEMGITVMKDAEHFNSFKDIMTTVNQKIDEFGESSIKANELLDSLGGAWKINDIRVLANGWDQIDKISKESLNSSGYSIAENAKAMNTLEKQVESLKNSFKELYVSFGNSGILDHLKGMVSIGNNVVSTFSKMPSELKSSLLILAEVAVAMKGLNSMTNLVFGQNFKQLLDGFLPKIAAFSNAFGEGNATMRAFGASTQELTRQLANGNIAADQFVAISDEIAKQMGISKSAMNTYALAEKELDIQQKAGLITEETKKLKLTEIQANLKGASVGTQAYTASQKALDAANKSSIMSTVMLNLAMAGITLAISLAIGMWVKYKQKQEEAKKAQEEFMKSIKGSIEQMQTQENLIKKYDELNKSEYKSAEAKKELLDIQKQLANSFPDLVDGITDEGDKLVTNTQAVKDQIQANKDLMKQKLLLANSQAMEQLPSLESDATNTKSRINEISNRIKTGDTKEKQSFTDESGQMVEYEIDVTKKLQTELQGLIAHYEELTPKIRNYKNIIDENNKSTKEAIRSEVIENIVRASSKENAEAYTAKLKEQGITQDMINDVIDENTKGLEKNIEVQKKGFDSTEGYNNAVKSFSDSLIKAKTDLSDINSVLDQHAESGEWNLETIIKLSDTYPQLLGLLNDEKGLEAELTKIKGDRVNVAKDALTKQIKNEESYLNEIFKGYNTDIANYKSAQEAKLAMANQFAQRLSVLNEAIIKSESARQAAIASGDQEAYEFALKRKAMLVGVNAGIEGQIANISTHIDNYFKLKQISLNANNFVGTGSKSYDGKSGSDTNSELEQKQNEALEMYKDVESSITEIIKKEVEERKKAIEDEFNTKRNALQKEKDLYNKQNEEDDYNKELKKEQDILAQIQNKISSSRDTNTLAGKARLDDLTEQAKAQQEKIDDMILNRTRDKNNELFDLELEKLDKQQEDAMKNLDNQYSEENISKMVNEALITGQLKEIDGSFINVITAFNDFQDKFNAGMTGSGQLIKTQFIDQWKEVEKLIRGTAGLSIGINFNQLPLPSYDVGTQRVPRDMVAKIHKDEMIVPAKYNPVLNGFDNFMTKVDIPKLPSISNNNSNITPTIQFNQPLVSIAGGISNEIDLDNIINKARDGVVKDITQTFRDLGLYNH